MSIGLMAHCERGQVAVLNYQLTEDKTTINTKQGGIWPRPAGEWGMIDTTVSLGQSGKPTSLLLYLYT